VSTGHDHQGARGEVGAELLAAGKEILAIVDAPGEYRPQEARRGLLGGTRRRADTLDLGRDQRRHQAQQRAIGALAAGPHAQLTDDGVGDLQIDRRHILGITHERALIRGRARGDGEHAR
jgi:hypothetical protein